MLSGRPITPHCITVLMKVMHSDAPKIALLVSCIAVRLPSAIRHVCAAYHLGPAQEKCDRFAIFRVTLAMCVGQLRSSDLQVPAVHICPGGTGQQARKQVLAAYCVSVGAPYERPDCEVRHRLACLSHSMNAPGPGRDHEPMHMRAPPSNASLRLLMSDRTISIKSFPPTGSCKLARLTQLRRAKVLRTPCAGRTCILLYDVLTINRHKRCRYSHRVPSQKVAC